MEMGQDLVAEGLVLVTALSLTRWAKLSKAPTLSEPTSNHTCLQSAVGRFKHVESLSRYWARSYVCSKSQVLKRSVAA